MIPIADKVLAEDLCHALDGVAVAELGDDVPRVVYANATLALLLGRAEDDVTGLTIGELESETCSASVLADAGGGVQVRLRHADGSFMQCERSVVRLSNGQAALFYRPVPRAAAGAAASAFERSTGLSTHEHLLEVLRRDWSIATRDGRTITLMRFDVDFCMAYQEVFGRGATEAAMRQVGRTIGSAMRRTSDVVARVGPDEFMVLGVAMEKSSACQYANSIRERIMALAIHHPRSPTGRYLTASAGVATIAPPKKMGSDAILEATQTALREAKSCGGNQVVDANLDSQSG